MSENMPSCFAARCIWDLCTEIRKGHLNTFTQYQIYKHNLLIEEGCFMSMIYRSENICVNVVLFFFFFLLSAWNKFSVFEWNTEGKRPRAERGNKQHVWMLVVTGARLLIQIVMKGSWGGSSVGKVLIVQV